MRRIPFYILCLFLLAGTLMAEEQENQVPGVYARFNTSKGSFLFTLDYKNLPLTVSNFVALCEGKMTATGSEGPYYNGKVINRRIKDYALFIADDAGDVDYSFPREENSSFTTGSPGTLMMVSRMGQDHGSRLIILVTGDSFLDKKYSPFGQLVSGEKVLSSLKKGDAIESVEIIRIGAEAQNFHPGEKDVQELILQSRQEKREAFYQDHPDIANVLQQMGEDIQESETGIFYKIFSPGTGSKPRPGNTVRVHYIGRFLSGQEFDNSYKREEAFQFTIGKDGVIPGWMEMVLGMQSGEKRGIIIPPDLAYGEKGFGPIPPDSWLVFEMELVDFQ